MRCCGPRQQCSVVIVRVLCGVLVNLWPYIPGDSCFLLGQRSVCLCGAGTSRPLTWSRSCRASRHSACYQGASLTAALALMNTLRCILGKHFLNIPPSGDVEACPPGRGEGRQPSVCSQCGARLLSLLPRPGMSLFLSSPSQSVMNGATEAVGGALRWG